MEKIFKEKINGGMLNIFSKKALSLWRAVLHISKLCASPPSTVMFQAAPSPSKGEKDKLRLAVSTGEETIKP